MGIYQSICQAKLISKQTTVPSWKIWDPERTVKPEKKVNRRVTQLRQKKYKETRISSILKVTDRLSRVPDIKEKHIHKLHLIMLKLL